MGTRTWKESDIGKLVYDVDEDKLKVGSTSGWTDVGLSSSTGDVTEAELYSASGTIISTLDTQIYATSGTILIDADLLFYNGSGVLDTLIDNVQAELIAASGDLVTQLYNASGTLDTLVDNIQAEFVAASGDYITQLYSASGAITSVMATDAEVDAISGYLQGQITAGGVTEAILDSASGTLRTYVDATFDTQTAAYSSSGLLRTDMENASGVLNTCIEGASGALNTKITNLQSEFVAASGDIIAQLYSASGTLAAAGGGTSIPASGDYEVLTVSGSMTVGNSPVRGGIDANGAYWVTMYAGKDIRYGQSLQPQGGVLIVSGVAPQHDAQGTPTVGIALETSASGDLVKMCTLGPCFNEFHPDHNSASTGQFVYQSDGWGQGATTIHTMTVPYGFVLDATVVCPETVSGHMIFFTRQCTSDGTGA